MKLTKNILAAAVIGALALPLASFAAEGKKGGGKGADEAFAKADTNSDGKLSKEEFAAGRQGGGKKKKDQ